jgi:hypothetical protein
MNEKVVYTYWLNWMGPINREWIQVNGDYWASGRIDVSPGNDEIGVPIMHSDDWQKFCVWLGNLITTKEQILSLDKILELYYNDGNSRIVWWKKEDKI